ncbi:MAG: 2-oxo acid dehydrogenase subunit E2 [Eubacteriales bacterium]|nr:2-oxo acid dehydrogenase subunit E2 [Eubacteriales bacterium]
MSERKRKRGDRRDARWVSEAPALLKIMPHLMPNRTDCEVYLNDTIDATELVKFLEKKNAEHPEYKTTLFHAFVVCVARMLKERPKMNYFVQGRRLYERDDIFLSFIVKRRFSDHAEESLMTVIPKDEDTLDTVSRKIYGDVRETRKSEHATDGIDVWLERFASLPRIVLMIVLRIVRWLDFWGLTPKELTKGDTNYASVLLSNLGSIKGPAVYHHLNNYGTNSIVVTIGTLHKQEMTMPDGTKEIRDVFDIGATLDERIADGFYFVRSLNLVKYIFAHPELLDKPLGERSDYDYK